MDGSPERVALLGFDVSVLNGAAADRPTQILGARLRLYALTAADFGGSVSVFPEGDLDADATTWENSPCAADRAGTPVGQFRSVWRHRFYELDLTPFLRAALPRRFVVRIASDRDNGVMYRSTDGAGEKGPGLLQLRPGLGVRTMAVEPERPGRVLRGAEEAQDGHAVQPVPGGAAAEPAGPVPGEGRVPGVPRGAVSGECCAAGGTGSSWRSLECCLGGYAGSSERSVLAHSVRNVRASCERCCQRSPTAFAAARP